MIDIGHDIGNFDFFVGHSALAQRARFFYTKKRRKKLFRELGILGSLFQKYQIDDFC